ncbi:MAG TPA: hypothetical protein VNW29_02145 [Candidatus Sulfotelmatobacter sp.]|nr:hypothetical protein [Candidatus Sulfotelmatobacter sp.]
MKIIKPFLQPWREFILSTLYNDNPYGIHIRFAMSLKVPKPQLINIQKSIIFQNNNYFALSSITGTCTISQYKGVGLQNFLLDEAGKETQLVTISKNTLIVLIGISMREYAVETGKTSLSSTLIYKNLSTSIQGLTNATTTGFILEKYSFFFFKTHEKRGSLGERSFTHDEIQSMYFLREEVKDHDNS